MIADIILENSGTKYLYAAQVAHTTTRSQSRLKNRLLAGPLPPIPLGV